MLDVQTPQEVFAILQEHFSVYHTGEETVALPDLVGRIVAADVRCNEDIPNFHRSSVDGYAVRAQDTFGAGDAIPAQLKLIEEVKMGIAPSFSLSSGEATYIPTGGELPSGADAVVMIEYTEDFQDGWIYSNTSVAPGAHVVFRGDDSKRGEIVLAGGQVIRPQDIGALAAMGYTSLSVRRKLIVGILSTGDELVSVDKEVKGAQMRDVNSHVLYAGVLQLGAIPLLLGIVQDEFSMVREAVVQALVACDIVLVSGGSSVGNRDETLRVIESLKSSEVFSEVLVQGIAIKPGKPTIIGEIHGKAVIGLPGHPVSAYMVFHIFVSCLIRMMSGTKESFHPIVPAILSSNAPSNHGREELLLVTVEEKAGKWIAHPLFGKSGLITLLTKSDGYVRINRDTEGLQAGNKVEVFLF